VRAERNLEKSRTMTSFSINAFTPEKLRLYAITSPTCTTLFFDNVTSLTSAASLA
jgi:hypothetical protein